MHDHVHGLVHGNALGQALGLVDAPAQVRFQDRGYVHVKVDVRDRFPVSGPKNSLKHKVFGQDIPGTSGTQTSRIWKNFMQENFGLIFRTLLLGGPS